MKWRALERANGGCWRGRAWREGEDGFAEEVTRVRCHTHRVVTGRWQLTSAEADSVLVAETSWLIECEEEKRSGGWSEVSKIQHYHDDLENLGTERVSSPSPVRISFNRIEFWKIFWERFPGKSSPLYDSFLSLSLNVTGRCKNWWKFLVFFLRHFSRPAPSPNL